MHRLKRIPEHVFIGYQEQYNISPAKQIYSALCAAKGGVQVPQINSQQMLHSLQLTAPHADGKTFFQRLSVDNAINPVLTIHIIQEIQDLIRITKTPQATSAQISLLSELASIATRHFLREGNICPLISEFLLDSDERYISTDIKNRVQASQRRLHSLASADTPQPLTMRNQLVEKLNQTIPSYEITHGSQISQAFQELQQVPALAQTSCLRIAKAYLVEGYTATEEKNSGKDSPDIKKAHILRWLLVEALKTPHTRDELFGPYAQDFEKYFDTILFLENDALFQKIHAQDVQLSGMHQAEFLSNPTPKAQKFHKRISESKPIVFSMANALFGDTLLLSSVVAELATSLSVTNSHSTIRFMVKKQLAPLITRMLSNYENIQVIPTEGYLDPLTLSRLSIGSLTPAEALDPHTLIPDDFTSQAGTILSWEQKLVPLDSQLDGNLYFRLNPPQGLIDSGNDSEASYTFRQVAQRYLSHLLGIKLFNSSQRNTREPLASRGRAYLSAYLKSKENGYIQEFLAQVETHEGFKNGFTGIITDGSSREKHLTPSLMDTIAKHMQQSNKGVVIIRTDNVNGNENSESAWYLNLFQSYGIPTLEFHPTHIIEDTIALLQKSQGTIGPDSFLTHCAEFFSDQPVLDFHSISPQRRWKVDERQITAQHPLAKRAEEHLIFAFLAIIPLYTQEIMHPLTILSDADKQLFHPLVVLAQEHQQKDTLRALELFLQLI